MTDPVIIETAGMKPKFIPSDLTNLSCMTLTGQTNGNDSNIGLLGTGYQVPADHKAIVTKVTILNGHDSTILNAIKIWYADNSAGTTNAVYLVPAEINAVPPNFQFTFDCYWTVPAGKYINFDNAGNAAWESGYIIMQFAEVAA